MNTALAVLLVCGLAWLYAGVGRALAVQWATDPDASYGAILAIVSIVLIWKRRRELVPHGPLPTDAVAGLLAAAAGLVFYLAGTFAADLFTTRASFVVVLGGLTWFLCGTRPALTMLTPLVFLLLAIPLPDLVVTTLTSSLQTVAARSAEGIISLTGIAVFRDGNVLELPRTTLQIAEACSGLRSVVSLASIGVLLAWATPGTMFRRAILIAATVPISVLANGFRVAGTGIASETWGPAMTRDPWHTFAGWCTFVVSLGVLWLIRWALMGEPSPV